MKAFSDFIFNVSKCVMKKPEDLADGDRCLLLLDETGFSFSKCYEIISSICVLTQDFAEVISLIPSECCQKIEFNYFKIMKLIDILKNNFDTHDIIPQEAKNILVDASKKAKEIEPYIPYMVSIMSISGIKNMNTLQSKVDCLLESFEKIKNIISLKQNEIISKNKGENDKFKFVNLVALIIALQKLEIELICLLANKEVKESDELSKLTQEYIEEINDYQKNIFELQNVDEKEMFPKILNINLKLSQLVVKFNSYLAILEKSEDFVSLISSFVLTFQMINLSKLKPIIQGISYIMKTFSKSYIKGNQLDKHIQIAKEIIRFFYDNSCKLSKDLKKTYKSLSLILSICLDDSELASLAISSTIRFCSIYSPDFGFSEDILFYSTRNIALIIKDIFKKTHDFISELSLAIDNNIEFFGEKELNEINFYIDSIKKIKKFNINNQDFLIIQNNFFNLTCSLPYSLLNLIASCSNNETRSNLICLFEKLKNLSTSLSKWTNELYLNLFTIIINRAKILYKTISFLITSINEDEDKEELTIFNECISNINRIIKKVDMIGNIQDVLSLINIFSTLSKEKEKIQTIVSSYKDSLFYKIFQRSLELMDVFLRNIHQYIPSLKQLFENSNFTTLSLLSNTFASFSIFQSYQRKINKSCSLLFYISAPFTYISILEAILKSSSNNSSIMKFIYSLNISKNIIWKIANDIVIKNESLNIQDYLSSFLEGINDLKNAILELPQPSKVYTYPKNISRLKQLDAKALSLNTQELTNIGYFINKTLKNGRSTYVKNTINTWYSIATSNIQINYKSIEQSASELKNCIIHLLTNSIGGIDNFIKCFSTFSVNMSIVKNSNIIILHQKLIKYIFKYLEVKQTSNLNLFKILMITSMICSINNIIQLRQDEFEWFYIKCLRKLLENLQFLRSKNKLLAIQNMVQLIYYISDLQAYLLFKNKKDIFNYKEFFKLLISNKIERGYLNETIMQISNYLMKLQKSQYSMLKSIRDNDIIHEFLNNKIYLFQKNLQKIIYYSQSKQFRNDKFEDKLNLLLWYCSDIGIITMHEIITNNLLNKIAKKFDEAYTNVIIKLFDFINKSYKAKEDCQNDYSSELITIDFEITKLINDFNDILEIDEQNNISTDSVETSFYIDLLFLIQSFARIIGITSNSIVKEMYFIEHKDIIMNIKNDLSRFDDSLTKINSTGINSSLRQIQIFSNDFKTKTNTMIKDSYAFDHRYAIKNTRLFNEIQNIFEIILNLIKTSQILTQSVDILPDIEAANKIPNDYIIPSSPQNAPKLVDAHHELIESQKQLLENKLKFKSIVESKLTNSNNILLGLKSFIHFSNLFVEKALAMMVSTFETRYQVEQQIVIHFFGNSINCIQQSIRNKLLQKPNSYQDIEKSFSIFDIALERCMEIAEAASKIDIENDDDSNNEILYTFSTAIEKSKQILDLLNNIESKNKIKDMKEIDELKDEELTKNFVSFIVNISKKIFLSINEILIFGKENCKAKKFLEIFDKNLLTSIQSVLNSLELFSICIEIIVSDKDEDILYKVIAVLSNIKKTIESLVEKIKTKYEQKILQNNLNVVLQNSELIISKTEKIIEEKQKIEIVNKLKNGENPMILKLNIQTIQEQKEKQLKADEMKLQQLMKL